MVGVSLAVPNASPARADFGRYRVYPTGSEPAAAAVADVTGDGRKDVLVTTTSLDDPPNDFRLFLFRQRQDGTLSSPERFPTFGGSGGYFCEGGLDTGDLEGDGRTDVVVAMGRGINVYYQRRGDLRGPSRLRMRRSNGTPLQADWPIGGIQPAITDVDGDGRNDIVIDHRISTHPGGIDLLRHTKNGFVQSRIATNPAGEIEVADLNRDDSPDVASGVFYSRIRIFMNGGGSSWRTRKLPPRESGIEAADVTGDHRADVIYASSFNGHDAVGVFPQLRRGFRRRPHRYPSYEAPGAAEAGRINSDRLKDVAVLHSDWLRVGIYMQRRSGRLSSERLLAIPSCTSSPDALALGDVSGDGRTDIAIACDGWGLVVLRQRGG
ncbi:MAG: FG-GAP repeat domain-containing protein [Solirubrobacterales bacterium]